MNDIVTIYMPLLDEGDRCVAADRRHAARRLLPREGPLLQRKGIAMTRWIDILENPQAIVSLFGDVVPSLSDVDLHSVRLNRVRCNKNQTLVVGKFSPQS